MPHVRVATGVDVTYEIAGEGPRALFIGGTGGDLRVRPGVLDGPLPRACEVLAYDQRGLGRSSSPPGDWTMADYADDADALLDALGWDRAHVVGVSFGGMVAQELALRHPNRIDRLVLCCTSAGGAGGASYPLHELAALDPDVRFERQLELSDVRRDAAWRAAHPEVLAQLRAQAEAAAAVGAEEPGRADGARRQLEARRHHDTWDRLAGIATTTLVAAGRFDGIAPLANAEALAARLPDARLEVFDGGHLFLVQDRAAWPAIVAFLTS
ncbi:MAG TPA: alpha/beta fold hydrolase [Acidimicrobiales bacterium]|nr:alpha/beta fold hydrolase [Acidimicrobiales bacterium]